MRRTLAGVALAVLLSACGFQLRGQAPLPAVAARPYVETADRLTPLYAALDRRLRAAGAVPAASASEASVVVRLHLDEGKSQTVKLEVRNAFGWIDTKELVLKRPAAEKPPPTAQIQLPGGQ